MRTASRPGGEQRDDVRVLQRGGELRLTAEPVDVHAGAELGRQHLDHHAPPQTELLGEVHAAHAAAAELLLEAVRAAERGREAGEEIRHELGRYSTRFVDGATGAVYLPVACSHRGRPTPCRHPDAVAG